MVVDAGGGDVGVAEPLLELGDVRLVVERIGGGRRAKCMGADLEVQLRLGSETKQPRHAVG